MRKPLAGLINVSSRIELRSDSVLYSTSKRLVGVGHVL